jgi:hypothetical protein
VAVGRVEIDDALIATAGQHFPVFLDGQFMGSTTTFENYHDSIDSVANHIADATVYQTDRVFFRPSANGAPQDGAGGADDQGFYSTT